MDRSRRIRGIQFVNPIHRNHRFQLGYTLQAIKNKKQKIQAEMSNAHDGIGEQGSGSVVGALNGGGSSS